MCLLGRGTDAGKWYTELKGRLSPPSNSNTDVWWSAPSSQNNSITQQGYTDSNTFSENFTFPKEKENR